MQLNEDNYWQLISDGDIKVFEIVFKNYYKPLCNYANTLLKDIDESEETVQNLFYKIWNKRETIVVSGALKSYLYRATHNECLNKIKHGKVKHLYAEDYKKSANDFEDGVVTIQSKELVKEINQAIDELPEQCQKVFKLSRFENLKYSEIAEKLSISIKTVENHMGKALKILRDQLKDHLSILIFLLFFN